MSDAGNRRRDKAAAARQQANVGEKRRERTVRIAGGATVLVVVAAIIGLAFYAKSTDTTGQPVPVAQPDPSAPLPAGVLPAGDAHEYGVPYGAAAADAPILAIWEDFQCPACGAVEQANGEGIAALAEAGKVRLIWRPTTFLDANLGSDASSRAVAAWGCAIDAGKSREYHDLIYANQPEVEGTGWTDEQLIGFAEQSGITGPEAEKFASCVADRTYLVWGANSTQAFYGANVQGTPSATLNGQDLATEILVDPVKLEEAVTKAVAG